MTALTLFATAWNEQTEISDDTGVDTAILGQIAWCSWISERGEGKSRGRIKSVHTLAFAAKKTGGSHFDLAVCGHRVGSL